MVATVKVIPQFNGEVDNHVFKIGIEAEYPAGMIGMIKDATDKYGKLAYPLKFVKEKKEEVSKNGNK